MFDVDPLGLLTREVLRERAPALLAEACAWSVGLSDKPHHARRDGRLVPSGMTLGLRAEAELQLGDELDPRLELGDARPGTFQDALNALTQNGRLYADEFEEQVLGPFVLDTCLQAAKRAPEVNPREWAELLDDLGEDGTDLDEVVRAAEWEAPLGIEAEQLVLAALGDVPLVEVEAEGLPLSLVRAAEAHARAAAPMDEPEPAVPEGEELAGALFLADVALRSADLPVPVPPTEADRLLNALVAEGIEAEEVLSLLPFLPIQQDTADEVIATVTQNLRQTD
jgi:hypothetical protein